MIARLRHSLSRLPLRKTTLLKQVLRQKPKTVGTANAAAASGNTSEVAKTLQAAAEAVGLRDGRELEVTSARSRCDHHDGDLGQRDYLRQGQSYNLANHGRRLKPIITPPSITIRPPCAWK